MSIPADIRNQNMFEVLMEALLVAEQEKKDALAAEELRRRNLQRNAFIGGFGLMLALAGTFFFQRNRINRERRRSEELLLNILPEEVADELKEKGEAEARHFASATILFTDFKGFTQLSERVSPTDLVAELNTCFKAFDAIMGKYRIEKIKTIGDAYMAAGGLPDPKHGSPADVVRAALEMQDFMKELKAEREALGRPFFEMRVGIHTGPVVAGIVGVKKFQYDIWGDTVNTASRMESSGAVGEVNISRSTYELVKMEPGLTFTPRGKVQAKGKGEMDMFFAEISPTHQGEALAGVAATVR
jgi:class 3 adenylate cyclase